VSATNVSEASAEAVAAKKPGLREVLASPKMVAIMILGAASGFPNQVTESTLQAWLKDMGQSNTTIGILSYVGLPYLLKFLWAPLLDRYPLPLLDRRRGWMLVTQLILALTIALMAVQNPAESLVPIAICAATIVFFSASQDILFDAYRTDVAQPAERGAAAAATQLGYRASAWIAFALALILADAFGWRLALFAVAGIMGAFAIATLLAPSPQYRSPPPPSLADSVITPLKELLGTPGTIGIVVLIMVFKIGDAFALKLFTPFLMDTGFSKTEIALVAKAVLTTSSIVGAIIGGIWMVKLGLFRSMLLFGFMQAVSNLAYYVLAISGKSTALMVTAVAIDNMAGAMGNIAVVALIMALCDPRYSAFQYALLSVLALLPRYSLGGPAGWLADHGGWPVYYIVSFFVGLPGVVMAWFLRDRVRALDVKA
jgi:PAT family beta-lactamase induction signal transducer AmpG